MAGLDRLTGTIEQYEEFLHFWVEHKDQQKEDLGGFICLYLVDQYCEPPRYPSVKDFEKIDISSHIKHVKKHLDSTHLHIVNLSDSQNLWLSKYCGLDFVKRHLARVYPANWVGFSRQNMVDFSKKPFIAQISLKGVEDQIYLFKNRTETEVDPIENILFYGTTYLLKVYTDALNTAYYQSKHGKDIENILVDYYGIRLYIDILDRRVNVSDITTEVENKNVAVYMPKYEIFIPSFTHSYTLSDAYSYEEEEIFLSLEQEAADFTRWRGYEKGQELRVLRSLPEYIYNQIEIDT